MQILHKQSWKYYILIMRISQGNHNNSVPFFMCSPFENIPFDGYPFSVCSIQTFRINLIKLSSSQAKIPKPERKVHVCVCKMKCWWKNTQEEKRRSEHEEFWWIKYNLVSNFIGEFVKLSIYYWMKLEM